MSSHRVRFNMMYKLMWILSVFASTTASSCNYNVHVQQHLHKEGFHRDLVCNIFFNKKGIVQSLDDCFVCADQSLPSGVYVDPDELSDLVRANRLNAMVKDKVNVELPAEESVPINVYVMDKVKDSRVDLWIPIHARYYHPISGGGYARNEIELPKLYIQCPDNRIDICGRPVFKLMFPCNGNEESCNWRRISYTAMTDTLIWEVPVGNLDHYYLVAIGTVAVIVIGSLYLLKTIYDFKMKLEKKDM